MCYSASATALRNKKSLSSDKGSIARSRPLAFREHVHLVLTASASRKSRALKIGQGVCDDSDDFGTTKTETYTRARTRERETAHLTSRTYGKRQPSVRQATRVPTEAFSSDSRGPSTSSRVQRGHLHTNTRTQTRTRTPFGADGQVQLRPTKSPGMFTETRPTTLREEGLRGRLCVPASKIFRLSPRL